MGLSQPGAAGGRAPNAIWGKCNTPPSTTFTQFDFDAFRDWASQPGDIDGGDLDDRLAALGLSYASQTFTALETGVWAVRFSFKPKAAPASQLNEIRLYTFAPDGLVEVKKKWSSSTLPPEADCELAAIIPLEEAGTFYAYQVLTGSVSDNEATIEASIAITRLL